MSKSKAYNKAIEFKNKYYRDLSFYEDVYNDDHEMYLKDIESAPHRKKDIDFIEKYLYNKENNIKDVIFENKFKKYAKKHGLYLNDYNYNDRAIRKSLEIIKDNRYSELKTKHTNVGFHRDEKDPYDTCFFCVESPDCICLYKEDPQNPKNVFRYQKWHYLCKYTNHNKFHGMTKWYSNKYVCFDCKHIFKRPIFENRRLEDFIWPCCTMCKKHMICVDVTFAPPPKTDTKKWKELEKSWYDYSKLTYHEYYNKI